MGGGFGGDMPDNAPPEGFGGERPQWPEGDQPDHAPPEGFEPTWPEGERPEPPEGFDGERPMDGDHGGHGKFHEDFAAPGEGNTMFYMQDEVNCFSGITAVNE